LYTCNLACRGCTVERHTGKLSDRLSVAQCLNAVEESNVPIVSVCGGEPMLYPELPELLSKLIERGKYIILCTNAQLLDTKMFGIIPPDRHLFINVHLDGMRQTQEYVCNRPGVWDKSIAMIKESKQRGYLTITNCTVYKETNVDELEELCQLLTSINIDGIFISPGYQFESVKEDVFLTQKDIEEKFARIKGFVNKYKILNTPAFFEFCAGERQLDCTPYSTVNYTPHGWKAPCYLVDSTEYYDDFKTFWESVNWDYWEKHTDPRCANCRMHSGFEQNAVAQAMTNFKDVLKLAAWQFSG
ncbi:adenosyl-hopene transferase HpnH, partial [bacterium]|nr:adenosyl-hopene transferase HpnH [bacterium]